MLTVWLSSSFFSAGLSVWEAAFLLTREEEGTNQLLHVSAPGQMPPLSADEPVVGLDPFHVKEATCPRTHLGCGNAGTSRRAFCAGSMSLDTRLARKGRMGSGGRGCLSLQEVGLHPVWVPWVPGFAWVAAILPGHSRPGHMGQRKVPPWAVTCHSQGCGSTRPRPD